MKTFDPASIATRRKKLRKTQQDLARETGLSSTAIYYIEKGRKGAEGDHSWQNRKCPEMQG